LTTTIHALGDALGNPLGCHLTGGPAHDLEGAEVLLEIVEAEAWLADRADDAAVRVINRLQEKPCQPVIPPQSNRKLPRSYDKFLYQARHLLENFLAKLKQYRAIATRYDKTSRNFWGAIYLAASVIWLN
jgi:transposase